MFQTIVVDCTETGPEDFQGPGLGKEALIWWSRVALGEQVALSDIPCHHLIARDGSILNCVPRCDLIHDEAAGELHIMLAGGADAVPGDDWEEYYTAKQMNTLQDLIDEARVDNPDAYLRPHESAELGFNLSLWKRVE